MTDTATNATSTCRLVCPACGSFEPTRTQHISIEAQHAAYFPWDRPVQSQLTKHLASVGSGYDLMTCGVCGLTFASPMTAPSSAWYQLAYEKWNVKPEQRWEYSVVVRELTSRDFVYEIGCGFGAFLMHCKIRDVPAFGIDFSAEAVAACQRDGLDASSVDIGMKAAAGGRKASVVVSYHVLEHLARPDDLFRLASDVASDGAVLWVSVPNSSRISRVLGVTEPMDDPPHHLTKWTDRAFEAVGARNGWELETVIREPFSWRSALYVVVADSRMYRGLMSRGWLRLSAAERVIRLAMYPFAFFNLCTRRDRHRMTGFSMIARYRIRGRMPASRT